MNWTLPSLLSDVLDAWSGDSWPYTLGFWIIVGGLVWLATRGQRKRSNSD